MNSCIEIIKRPSFSGIYDAKLDPSKHLVLGVNPDNNDSIIIPDKHAQHTIVLGGQAGQRTAYMKTLMAQQINRGGGLLYVGREDADWLTETAVASGRESDLVTLDMSRAAEIGSPDFMTTMMDAILKKMIVHAVLPESGNTGAIEACKTLLNDLIAGAELVDNARRIAAQTAYSHPFFAFLSEIQDYLSEPVASIIIQGKGTAVMAVMSAQDEALNGITDHIQSILCNTRIKVFMGKIAGQLDMINQFGRIAGRILANPEFGAGECMIAGDKNSVFIVNAYQGCAQKIAAPV